MLRHPQDPAARRRSWKASTPGSPAASASRAGLRTALDTIEPEGATGRVKLNPLASWDAARIEAYRVAYDLPAHPLVARGFRSIGCATCTRPTRAGEDARAGRWAGIDKTECGIHLPQPYGDNI